MLSGKISRDCEGGVTYKNKDCHAEERSIY